MLLKIFKPYGGILAVALTDSSPVRKGSSGKRGDTALKWLSFTGGTYDGVTVPQM